MSTHSILVSFTLWLIQCFFSFKKYGGDFIQCIWIHKVDGANNSDSRFATAFKDVPSTKFRVYTDAEIPGLAKIDVAGGKC